MDYLKKKIDSIYLNTGLITSLCGILIWLPFYILVKLNVIDRYSTFMNLLAPLLMAFPVFASIISGIRLSKSKSEKYYFDVWIKTSFSNFAVAAIILFIIFISVNGEKGAFVEILFRQIWIIILTIIVGLFTSFGTTLILRKDH